ncbi:MAG: helix-turn-helix domain-containing protein [Betaproteobacteria bacterium]|nr:helix-turn-helix domain-containing protein [Betaproteobacteria bacterium]
MTEPAELPPSQAQPEAGPEALGVGRALSEARAAQGLAIADISHQLKFMPRQLEALENERFDLLPGPTIARGMVRTYARFLKLDPEPLLERMAGRVDPRDATPQLAARYSQPVPFADHGRRSTLVYLSLSAAILAIAAGVLYEWKRERPAADFVAAAAPESAEASAAPAQAAPVAPPGPIASAAPVAIAAPSSAAPLSGSVPVSAPSAEPKTTGSHRMVFRFQEEAWIEVTDGAGRLLASSLNAAGSERVIQGRPPFSLVIGNASHVKLTYNEKDVDLQPHVRVEVARFTLK